MDNLKSNFNTINVYNEQKKSIKSKINEKQKSITSKIKEAKNLLESKINNNEIINIKQNDLNKLTEPRTI